MRETEPTGARVIPLALPLSDAALVAALLSGSPGARDVLCDRYAGDVARVLQRILGSDSDLQDVAQDVFIAALGSLHKLRKPEALRSWLIGIAVKKAKHRIHRRSRWYFLDDTRFSENHPSVAPQAELSEAVRAAYDLLGTLPADERIAFALRFIDGMELTDVAAACDVSLSTIKRRVLRAQKKFFERAARIDTLREWVGQE